MQEKTKKKILDIVNAELDIIIDDIKSLDQNELGLSSIDIIAILVNIEKEFGIRLPSSGKDILNIEYLTNVVEKQIKEKRERQEKVEDVQRKIFDKKEMGK